MNGGLKANRSGKSLEKAVAALLSGSEWHAVPGSGLHLNLAVGFAEDACTQKGFYGSFNSAFVQQVTLPVRGILQNEIIADFLLHSQDWPKQLFLSAKGQWSTGSANKKIEHEVREICECYPLPCAILVAGPEMNCDKIVNRIVDIANGYPGSIAAIWRGLDELQNWIRAGCKYPNGMLLH